MVRGPGRLGAAECPAGEEAAPVVRSMLERHRVGAGLLARGRQTLEESERDEKDRREHADLVVARETADEEGRDAHQQERADEDLLAAESVADVAHQERAERSGDVCNTEGGEGRDGGDGLVAFGEEDGGEDECGGCAVDREVVVLESTATPRCQRRLARRALHGGRFCHGIALRDCYINCRCNRR